MIELTAPFRLPLSGDVLLPGSKSISNRILLLDHVFENNTTLHNLSSAQDTELLRSALNNIKNKKTAIIDVNHAGTDFRFLTALLSITDGEWLLTGSDRLKERPISQLAEALKTLGAQITYTEKENFPPLKISGRKLLGGKVSLDSSISSQFISALLLISPLLEKGLEIELKGKLVSAPYLKMTVELLKTYGVEITWNENIINVHPKRTKNSPTQYYIESDWSSASYYYSICALSPGSTFQLKILQRQSLQADSILPDIYKCLGVTTEFLREDVRISHNGDFQKIFAFDFTHSPDIAQTIAVTCFALGVEAELTGLKTLRIKETDRINALGTELKKLGASVESGEDFIRIRSVLTNVKNQKTVINTYHDHRMAMSFAPLALKFGVLRFDDDQVVNKSYPDFWKDLLSLGFSVNLQP